MSDYISREELIDSLNTVSLSPECIRMLVYPREMVKMIICDCPKADVRKNIHGEWINAKVGRFFPSNDFKCSNCGNILNFDGLNGGRGDANFCPNCGADMRGGE